MSRRWLILVSAVAHLAVGFAVFASGAWQLERLDGGRHSLTSLAVMMPPPPAPSGGASSTKPPEQPPRPPRTPARGRHQPPKLPPPPVDPPPASDESLGTGPGPGTATDVGECLDNCAPTAPPAAPICGNGSVETGEQCDDGNTASGDGCSSSCRTEIKPVPTAVVAPTVLAGLRTSGETQVHPGFATQSMISRDRVDRVVGTVKLCVAIDGHVASAKMLQSTKYPDYDATILAAVQAWRYQPYTLDNKPVPVCSTVTFVYTIR